MKDNMGYKQLMTLFSYVYSRLPLGTLPSSIHQKKPILTQKTDRTCSQIRHCYFNTKMYNKLYCESTQYMITVCKKPTSYNNRNQNDNLVSHIAYITVGVRIHTQYSL